MKKITLKDQIHTVCTLVDKNFAKPTHVATLALQKEVFGETKFPMWYRLSYLYVVINTGQKNYRMKISPSRASGKIYKHYPW